MDEIVALAIHNCDLKQEIEELKRKLASKEEDEYVACPDNYIIIDDTDSDPSEPEFEDEAGADIMESSTGSNFQMTTRQQQYSPMQTLQFEHFCDSQTVCKPLFD